MSEYIAVNKSGMTHPVYADVGKQTYLGYIAQNEIYGIIGFSEGPITAIRARINGVVRDCYVENQELWGGSLYTPVSDYPYGTIYAWDYLINDYSYHDTYYMNRSATIYDAGGNVWGSVAAGQQVAAKQAYGGSNGSVHYDWLQINYVRSTSGNWVAINNAFGFVPIGLEYGSMSTTANIRGTW